MLLVGRLLAGNLWHTEHLFGCVAGFGLVIYNGYI